MPHSIEEYDITCPDVNEALLRYCRKLRSRFFEVQMENDRLRAENRKLKGEESGKIYDIKNANIEILKGRLL